MMPLPLALALLLPDAHAQDATTFDAHGFNLAAFTDDPRGPLIVQRPGSYEPGAWFAGALFEYAKSPLVYIQKDTDGTIVSQDDVLGSLFAANVSAGLGVARWLRVDATAPLYFTSTGAAGAPQGFDFGDLRLAAMLSFMRPGQDGGFGLGVVPYVDLPTGASTDFLGDGSLAGGAKVALTEEVGKLTVGGDAGVHFRQAVALDNLNGSDQIQAGLHLGYLVMPSTGANLEATIRAPFTGSSESFTQAPSELTASLRHRYSSGGHVVFGGSVGLTRGVGAAQYRLFLGGGFGTFAKPPILDTDGDGILDNVDTCPTEPETVNGYQDTDGCPDAATVTVTVNYNDKSVAGAITKLEGGETTLEHTEDRSPWTTPSVPGRSVKATTTWGECLAGAASGTTVVGDTTLAVQLAPVLDSKVMLEVVDSEGQAILGPKVSWQSQGFGCVPAGIDGAAGLTPVGKGVHTATVRADGYRPGTGTVTIGHDEQQTLRVVLEPIQAKVVAQKIVILEQVFFDYDAATIKPESYPILEDVVQVMQTHPEILKVEVGGHTDSDGKDAYNMELSQRRVEAVRTYLMNKGIAGDRLSAKGYGETKPLGTNATEAGKAKNRRVEFTILEPKP